MTASKPQRRMWRLTAAAVAACVALTACENKNEKRQQEAMAKMASSKPTVSVLTVYPANILLENNLAGRIESVRTTDVVPQITGMVKRRLFDEGAFVRAGQPLYQIDDASYAANLQSAEAALLTAQAALAKAQADVARYRPLVEADAISRQEWDAAVAAERSAHAQIKSAEAAIHAAQVNVRHSQIVAPISGEIGQSLVAEGALVNANSTKMATIRQNDPMYVNITQSATDFIKLKQQLMSGEKVRNSVVEVSIMLEDGTEYPYKGRLLFADSKVDKATGQMTVRGQIPNPDSLLMDGLYVRVKLPLAGILDAFLVPQSAVTRGKTDTVMIVNSEGKMEPRTVKIGGEKSGNWVITEGLQAGDKVVMDGTMVAAMRNAEKVETKEWQPPEDQAALYARPMPASDAEEAPAEDGAPATGVVPMEQRGIGIRTVPSLSQPEQEAEASAAQ